MSNDVKRLYRSKDERMVAGICGGLGEYFRIDPTIMRLIFIVLWFLTGFIPMLVIYVIMWLLIPQAPDMAAETTMEVVDTTAKEE
jgi:phage shock protein C